jgi:hypothetical protein
MFHTCAYEATIALTSVDQAMAAVPDSILKIGSANGFVLQEDMMLVQAQGGGIGMDRPKLKSPKLNQFNPLVLSPWNLTVAQSSGIVTCTFPYRPFTFRNQEEVTALTSNTNAGAQAMAIIAWFSNGVEPIPAGEQLIIRATSATAAVANTWTQLTYVLDQTLPEGLYVMLASEVVSTTAVAHRWTYWGQFYRPGMPSNTGFTNPQAYCVRELFLGAMGQFTNVTLPNIETFCGAADASHTILARIIKIA